MPGKSPAELLTGVRTLGLGLTLQALLYPLRCRYYERKFGTGDHPSVLRGLAGLFALTRPPAEGLPTPSGMTLPGDVLTCEKVGQTIKLRCQSAALQITVLAADLVRVRLSPTEEFPAPWSYAIAKPDEQWQPVQYELQDSPEQIEIRTTSLICRIHKRPCLLTFLDLEGRILHADSTGMGWRGRQVVRFARQPAGEHVYGLGEKAFPLDRRGRRYEMWNVDPQSYPPGAEPLYLNIPFYTALHEGRAYGVFYDNSYRAWSDAGLGKPDESIYWAEDGELRYYFFYGPVFSTVLERYTELTGRMRLPPLWALGYQQSRWSYYPEARVREIAALFRKHRIPCDVIHLDIHYMDGYRCFTWDPRRFPDPPTLLKDLHAQGFRVVSMIDCGIKADRKYHVCAEGLAQLMFCTYPDGKPAGGPVWPGECHFPDFTNPRVRAWWGQLYAPLLDAGVDGFWNDMNEPTVIGPGGKTLAGCVRHDWEGQGTDHRQAHNVYGMQMARASVEGLQRLRPHERPFVFTRSGWAGVQRYATSWTADNQSTWEHLKLSMAMVMSLGLSGLAFTGPDIGGFEGNSQGELLVRWTQMGAFLPFFRNHTALVSANQEPWAFGEPYTSLNRSAIELRYRLLPYLYTAVWQCSQTGIPVARPLVMAYPDDPTTPSLDDEFLCGDALLVAPVCEAGATSRQVYLPAGEWYDFWTDERHSGPATIDVDAPLERIPLFVRAGSVLPSWPVMQHIGEKRLDRLILQAYAGEGKSWLYEDDGHSLGYERGEYRLTNLVCKRIGDNNLSVGRHARGSYCPEYTSWEWHVHGLPGAPRHVLADGLALESMEWDDSRRVLSLDSGEIERLELE